MNLLIHLHENIKCMHIEMAYPTSSTLPNPPTPKVSMMLKSTSFRLEKKAFSASYLHFLKWKKGNFLEVWIEYVIGNVGAGIGAGRLFIRSLSFLSFTGMTGSSSRILTSLWLDQIKYWETVKCTILKTVSNIAKTILQYLACNMQYSPRLKSTYGRIITTVFAQKWS